VSDKVIRWTSIFIKEGMEPIEARARAIQKVKFLQEVDRIDASKNETDKGVYNV